MIGQSLAPPSTPVVLEEETTLGCLIKSPCSAMALTSRPSYTNVLCILELSSSRVWAESSGEMEGGVAHPGSELRVIPEWKV